MSAPGSDGSEHENDAQQDRGSATPPVAALALGVPHTSGNAAGGEQNARETKRKFWSDYTPIEKFTLALLFSNLFYVVAYVTWVYLDQRPYVATYLMDNIMRPTSGPTKVMATIVNSGKSTAYDIRIKYRVKVVNAGDRPSIEDILSDGEISDLGIEMPTQSSTKIRMATRESLTPEQNSALEGQTSGKALVAVISGAYRDGLYIRHSFLTCGIWKFEEGAFNGCAWPTPSAK